MANKIYPLLSSPIQLGNVTIRNRMFFTGHNSKLQEPDGLIGDRYIAYQVRRAQGGAGLQFLCAAAIDEMSLTSTDQLSLINDDALPGFRRMAREVESAGGMVFAQLLHPGREIYESSDGSRPRAVSASAVRTERHFVVPRELSVSEIAEIVQSYAAAARRAVAGGMKGLEIVGNQGNLPAQFLGETTNRRTDEYGGSPENRQRFLLEVLRAVRAAVGGMVPVGLRISLADLDGVGLESDESVAACKRIDEEGLSDWFHVVMGTAATRVGASHIVPAMHNPTGYMTPNSKRIKDVVKAPVISTGRYNDPSVAEAAIRSGACDAVGMTRAMISDPDLGIKVIGDRPDDIRACIGCVQACIGHFQKGYSVSCIQYPETGRETTLGNYGPAKTSKKILIAGGGPAGMKAAIVAAARGHRVALYEATGSLGGQANVAAKIPGRAEFGGIVTNLRHELEMYQVEVHLKTPVTRELVERLRPDVLVVATGGIPATPDSDFISGIQTVTAVDLLNETVKAGSRVVIADATADWVGPGVALKLARNGHKVTLAVNSAVSAENIPWYARDYTNGALHAAGVEVVNYARFFGADGGNVYFQHSITLAPIEMTEVDTLVFSFGAEADRKLERELQGLDIETNMIGDCWSPRTAEEAVLEGLKVAVSF